MLVHTDKEEEDTQGAKGFKIPNRSRASDVGLGLCGIQCDSIRSAASAFSFSTLFFSHGNEEKKKEKKEKFPGILREGGREREKS